MKLSSRLQRIADFVPEGTVVADVGTDHGHLPIYLVDSGKIKRAIAMDVRSGPLSRAQREIQIYGLQDRISIRLSDGLAALEPGEADTVVIAGMGGALIRKILGEGSHMWDSIGHYILSPQSELGETRLWLEQQGFSIQKEDMVLDDGKYYVMMDVVRGAMHYDHEYEYTYGAYLIREGNPVLKQHLEEKREKNRELIQRLEESRVQEISSRCLCRLKELREEEAQIEDALKAIRANQTK